MIPCLVELVSLIMVSAALGTLKHLDMTCHIRKETSTLEDNFRLAHRHIVKVFLKVGVRYV